MRPSCRSAGTDCGPRSRRCDAKAGPAILSADRAFRHAPRGAAVVFSESQLAYNDRQAMLRPNTFVGTHSVIRRPVARYTGAGPARMDTQLRSAPQTLAGQTAGLGRPDPDHCSPRQPALGPKSMQRSIHRRRGVFSAIFRMWGFG